MRTQAGFTLIELIAATVLLGFIAVFGAIFLATGIRGSVAARQSEEAGQKAQIALERIAIELRDMNGGPATGGTAPQITSTLISYTSSLPGLGGTRTLAYDSVAKTMTLKPSSTSSAYVLVDGVNSCTFSSSGASTTNNISFTVTFTMSNTSGAFTLTVKPRNVIQNPSSS